MGTDEKEELEEVYDDGQGRKFDILDGEIEEPQDEED